MDRTVLEALVKQYTEDTMGGKRDFLPLYTQPEKLAEVIAFLAEPFRGKVDYVAAPESLGFILGSLLAKELGVGFAALRASERYNPDSQLLTASFIDHSDHARTLQIRKDLIPAGSRILLSDDWVATAATMTACTALLEEADLELVGIASLGVDAHEPTRSMIESGLLHFIYCRR